MIRISQIEMKVEQKNEEDFLYQKCSNLLKISRKEIKELKIHRKSLDARKKPQIFYSYTVDVLVEKENKILKRVKNKRVTKTPNEEYKFQITGTKKLTKRPIVVGSGPAGLFCAYLLAENNYRPIILERGDKVEDRVKAVEEFWQTGVLQENSNVQFGEGGAGTFSDGKLNTQVKEKQNRTKKVLETFVECGAPEEILYVNNPHIGTDLLRKVIIKMRKKITAMGGEFHYRTCLTDIKIEDNHLTRIEINHKEYIETDLLVLAIGHSARDTFEMLYKKNIKMIPKPFAVGVRIEHPQKMMNKNQYGKERIDLPPASYKLTYQTKEKRGVYTFCMCPGGYVVNASSEKNRLAINGMSNYKRDTENANSAIIVTIGPKDFGTHALDGLNFQRHLEEKAYQVGQTKIPIQKYLDFKSNRKTTQLGEVKPVMKGSYTLTNLQEIFPSYIINSLIEAIEYFNQKIEGFGREDALLSAVESRTSSPVKIERNELGISSIEGIYPCGEGAGYAGGITSAAIDGIKTAENIAKVYKNKV